MEKYKKNNFLMVNFAKMPSRQQETKLKIIKGI